MIIYSIRRQKFFFALIIVLGLAFTSTAQTTRVLFPGNSYTGWNNMPAIFRELATEAGDLKTGDRKAQIGGLPVLSPGTFFWSSEMKICPLLVVF